MQKDPCDACDEFKFHMTRLQGWSPGNIISTKNAFSKLLSCYCVKAVLLYMAVSFLQAF